MAAIVWRAAPRERPGDASKEICQFLALAFAPGSFLRLQ
jgi:hypothetical protein